MLSPDYSHPFVQPKSNRHRLTCDLLSIRMRVLPPTPVVILRRVSQAGGVIWELTYPEEGAGTGALTIRLTARKWSRCGQLPDSRMITRLNRVRTSAATLIRHVRQVLEKPSPNGSRWRRRLKNRLRSGASIAAVGNSAGNPSSALDGGDWTTARRRLMWRFKAAA